MVVIVMVMVVVVMAAAVMMMPVVVVMMAMTMAMKVRMMRQFVDDPVGVTVIVRLRRCDRAQAHKYGSNGCRQK